MIVDTTSNPPLVCGKLLKQDLTYNQEVRQNYNSTFQSFWARSIVVYKLRSESKGSWFESDC